MASTARLTDVFRDRNLAVLLLLGFSSGLPISLVGPTLQVWLTVEGVDLATLGLLTLVGIPYTWKILWAPFMDRYVPIPFLGRRRGWLVITQLALGAGLGGMALLSPRTDMAFLASLALFVAFASASQDIVADAYRTDISKPEERGIVSALFVLGYRIALMVAGAFALLLAAGTGWLPAIGWQNTYLLMAVLMAVGLIATLWGREPEAVSPPRTLEEAVVGPLKEFFSRHGAWMMLAMIVLYKMGDAFALSLASPFLLRGVGFGVDDVAYANKVLGLGATLVGVLIGGTMMVRLGLYRSLMLFGILQAFSNLGYMALAMMGKSYALLYFVVGFDNLAGGMGTAAFVAFQMALCNHRFTAFQYAMLSGVAAIGRVYVGPAAGYMTDPKYLAMDWATFFFITFLTALPGLALLAWKRASVEALK
ncbi:muropeptide transporter AmpG [Betaproteobacteria bacterium GR16-43]|nr:muropeptide transporter AmpG [Betaproteobacteria bacterium GR16-43]